MTNANDPVFPILGGEKPCLGLSTRELFAAMALQGLLANHEKRYPERQAAMIAVNAADALIDALNKPQGS